MVNQQLIFDIGAHAGEDTEFYLKKGFSVVAVDAVRECCDYIANRLEAYVTAGKLRILNVCIAEKPGLVDFFVNETRSIWSTANPDWVERNEQAAGKQSIRTVQVQAVPLMTLFREFGVPRYCKIDIEGNDLAAVRSLDGLTEFPPFLSLESEKRSWEQLLQEFYVLQLFGYRRFKIINQAHVPWHISPAEPREGQACVHQFRTDSSGLFGEELPGRWMDAFEAVEAYKAIFLGYYLNGDQGIHRGAPGLPQADWYDTHAAR